MKLSEFELDVMKLFWDTGACSSPEIFQQIAKERKVVYSTVKTIVDRLEEKGAIKRDRLEGRSIVYIAAIEKDAISKQLLPDFLKRFFNGKPSHLITHLMQDEELSDDDISYLEKFLAEKKGKNKD